MTSPFPSDHTYTHGYDASVIDGHSKRTAQNSAGTLLGMLRPGMDVLDIGSGAGTITADLAYAVAPGRVVAVELDHTAAEWRRRTLEQRGINTVEVVVEDAHQLSYAEHSFDLVHAHQVLQHVADPVLVLQHMWRVTRPHGIVAARDADYTAFSW
ncbi:MULTISPECIES: class I SAM-dependent methyltransferase [Corynebacterium]|uniref:class I SAM-dependent methyltransferase n=1 Tax=Corynebacterium TaxID=1716 RepID=UPI001CEF76B6|nr:MULTISPECIES: class I SAM-dependent methyltransferase [Corynebacterium]